MEVQSDLVQRMEREDKAATDLQTMLAAYQADRTPERRMAYLGALHDFTEMVKLVASTAHIQLYEVKRGDESSRMCPQEPPI